MSSYKIRENKMADKMSSSKNRIVKVEELILSRIHLPNGIDDTDLTALFNPGHLNIYIRYKYSNIKGIVGYMVVPCYTFLMTLNTNDRFTKVDSFSLVSMRMIS